MREYVRARQRYILMALMLTLGVSQLPACAKAPPNLSPAGQIAFNQNRVIKGLDLLRDMAEYANNQTPPVISTPTTRRVVQYHQTTVRSIKAARVGWQGAVETGLDGFIGTLSGAEQQYMAPYAALVRTVLREVQ